MLAVSLGRKTTLVEVKDIDFIEAKDKYLDVYSGGVIYMATGTLKSLLDNHPDELLMVHRARIVNISKMEGWFKDPDKTVYLRPKKFYSAMPAITVCRRMSKEIKQRFKRLDG